jgi:hypothetical protein
MLDGLKRRLAATALSSLLKSLAISQDTRTTMTGLVAAAVLAVPGLDLPKLVAGDAVQIARVVSGLLVAWIGYLATKRGADGKTTLLGAAAGSLYAVQGSFEAVVTGVVIGVLGHLTNKPGSDGPSRSTGGEQVAPIP